MMPRRVLAALIVLTTFAADCSAFLPVGTKKFSASSLRAVEEEASEWYSPPPSTTTQKQSLPYKPQITEIRGHVDLQEFVEQDDRLCLVLFHAKWCKSCQKVGRLYSSLAVAKGDWTDNHDRLLRTGKVRFASVEYSANEGLSKRLGVVKLPTVFFYKQGEKVDDVSCGPKKFVNVLAMIDRWYEKSLEEIRLEQKCDRASDLLKQAGVFDTDAMSSPLQDDSTAEEKQPWWKRGNHQ